LAQDGSAVAITYSSAKPKADEVVRVIEATGGKAFAIRADNADASAVRNAVTETVKNFGKIDILVNNTGIAVISPLDQFRSTISIACWRSTCAPSSSPPRKRRVT
jgi:3-oxoacyl-[acyl-carrier protein] reductase